MCVFQSPKHGHVLPLHSLASYHPSFLVSLLMTQAQNICLSCWPSTSLLISFILLLTPDYSESLHSKQRQMDKDLFHTKPQLSGKTSLKLSDIPHHSSLIYNYKHIYLMNKYNSFCTVFCSLQNNCCLKFRELYLIFWLNGYRVIMWLDYILWMETACRYMFVECLYSWMSLKANRLTVCVTLLC